MEQTATTRRGGIRFSLKTMLLAVVPVAVGAAALRAPSLAWASAVVTITTVAVEIAIVAAIYDRPDRRPCWAGFAIFSIAYFLVLFIGENGLEPLLPTEQLNRELFQATHPADSYPPGRDIPLLIQKWPDESQVVWSVIKSFLQLGATESLLADTPGDAGSAGPPIPPVSPEPTAAESLTTGAVQNANPIAPASPNVPAEYDGTTKYRFRTIAQGLWGWTFGIVGACLAAVLSARNEQRPGGRVSSSPALAPIRSKPRRRARLIVLFSLHICLFAAGAVTVFRPSTFGMSLIALALLASLILAPICGSFDGGLRPLCVGFMICCGGSALLWMVGESWMLLGNSLRFWFLASIPSEPLNLLRLRLLPGELLRLPDHDERLIQALSQSRAAGQCVWAILFGCLGGAVAQALASRYANQRHVDQLN